ncbi:MAG: hypothetical protein RR891_01385 [Clostridium sp.]|uniref:hypothetical protein n=1 Tax=Clostridium sp. TaxID=1506 RepID=UPI003020AAF9
MDIGKVLKKQVKSYKRFMLSMGFIFILLPIVLFLSKKFNIFFVAYLGVIEVLILSAVLIRYNEEYLKFELNENKITIATVGGRIKYKISYDKVAMIHTIPQERYFEILIITRSRFRNKRMRVVTNKVIEKYKDIGKYYAKIKMPNDGDYYYFLVKRGGVKKYLLLDMLFRYSVEAIFTENAVENIKEYRKSNKIRNS